MTSKLWIANRAFEIGWPRVVTFADPGGWDARKPTCVHVKTPPQALGWRREPRCGDAIPGRLDDDMGTPACTNERPRHSQRAGCRGLSGDALLRAVRSRVRQVVVHHDGCTSSAMCFHVLHNERGLSCHLLIDNDGTIYQTLDLALAGWHARGHNDISVGIELCSRGEVSATRGACDRWGRSPLTCTVHETTVMAWGFTDDQRDALTVLARWIRRHLPAVPLDFPRAADGTQSWGLIDAPYSFAGWLGHYHTTRRKWDPGPFDFERFVRSAGAAVYYPVPPRGPSSEPVPVAEESSARAAEIEALNRRIADARCGIFPVGPFCEYQLWHGGAHLPAPLGTPVHAVLPGRLVAARAGHGATIGSTSFALVRHDVLGSSRELYSLYFHLDPDAVPAAWAAPLAARRGEVVVLDLPIDAGDRLGTVGRAGPDGDPQLHVEVFSVAPPDEAAFTVIESARNSRFCDDRAVLDLLGSPTPPFDDPAVRAAYAAHPALRRMVVRHCSEWSPRCGGDDWTTALAARSSQLEHELGALVAEQIEPTLWWTDEVSAALGLPRDAYVFHYHPITFLGWIADVLTARAATAAERATRFDQVTRGALPFDSDIDTDAAETAHDDREDDEDYARCREQLELDQIVEGHDGQPECWPWDNP